MYIPDVRSRKDGLSAAFGKDKDNAYYEGYMDESGKTEIFGYDHAVEQVELFFENYDGFSYDFERTLADRLREDLLADMEMTRNETVVSIIEGMDDGEYERRKAECDRAAS